MAASICHRRYAVALATLAMLALAACEQQPQQLARLPALQAKIGATSVSGISSGAYMAGQFQMAHGREVVGAAIIAGGPYGCAESLFADLMPGPGSTLLNATKAINGCMLNAMQMWGVPNPRGLAARTVEMADRGLIDPIDSIKSDRVYLFTGKEDRTVVPPIVRTAREFYQALGIDERAIKMVDHVEAGHAFVTEEHGSVCEKSGKPYIVDCDYDQAGDLLAHIYGNLKPRAASSAGGTYVAFDQRPFMQGLDDPGMSDIGVVYVPKYCASNAGCRVHIAFHGCAQNRATVGDDFIKLTGFARWADTNDLIVLYPQTATSPLNPQGCWDWWGYTGRDFLNKRAPQIEAIHRMLRHLAAPRVGS